MSLGGGVNDLNEVKFVVSSVVGFYKRYFERENVMCGLSLNVAILHLFYAVHNVFQIRF